MSLEWPFFRRWMWLVPLAGACALVLTVLWTETHKRPPTYEAIHVIFAEAPVATQDRQTVARLADLKGARGVVYGSGGTVEIYAGGPTPEEARIRADEIGAWVFETAHEAGIIGSDVVPSTRLPVRVISHNPNAQALLLWSMLWMTSTALALAWTYDYLRGKFNE